MKRLLSISDDASSDDQFECQSCNKRRCECKQRECNVCEYPVLCTRCAFDGGILEVGEDGRFMDTRCSSRSAEQVVLFRNMRLGPVQGEVVREKWTCSLQWDLFRKKSLVPYQNSVV